VIKGRKERSIIVRPKKQQESEKTKNVIKEKVDIKNMHMGISRFRKGNNGAVLIDCKASKNLETLKDMVQNRLDSDFKVKSFRRKSKVKTMNNGKEELKMDDKDLLNTIQKQNRIEIANEDFHMRLLKRIKNINRKEMNYPGRIPKQDNSIIMELDEVTHDWMLKEKRLNVGWRKYPVFDFVNVKRCYKYWGFYHIAKNCPRDVTCHKCAGNHPTEECIESKKRCINCIHKVQKYNLKIDDGHDALSTACPSYQRTLREEKRRADWSEK